ncbi:hypothetical protein CVT24_001945 [Panaeolus cyanescens]|uniref:F-box domain-containing protein n=1 Tax=Panaeolus cyanescens TaxID=181874 RepID=A0A409YHV2_9AGAR|nr:hypothetical protein CVT24_001945 [Panaeolus cyanescens]
MTINTLAPELILAISSYISSQDCKHLRLTCKQMGNYVADYLLRSIVIDVKRRNHAATAEQLRLLSRQQAPVAAVQRLVIKSLSPHDDAEIRRPSQKRPSARLSNANVAEAELGITEEVVYRFLKDALMSLKNVHTVVWTPHGTDTHLAHQILLSSLPGLPSLRHVEINVTHCKIPLDFCSLKSVQSIKYRGISQRFYDDNMKSVARALFQLPRLQSLDMECASHPTRPSVEAQNIHYLFSGQEPGDNFQPKLRHLGLWFYLIRLDSITLPYFRSLTSLELRNTNEPQLISSSIQPNAEQPLDCNSRFDDVWLALRHHQIHLEKISVDLVVPAFLDYLQSYTGVRSLVLSPRSHSGQSLDELATRFYQESLSAHATTLQNLAIRAVEEGPWCFSEKYQTELSQCQKLVSLHVAIESSQLSGRPYSQLPPESDAVAVLITLALNSISHLSSIYIKSVAPNAVRGGRRITAVEEHLSTVENQIMQSIVHYVPPRSCTRTPIICVCINQGHNKMASPAERWFGARHDPQGTLSYIECVDLY